VQSTVAWLEIIKHGAFEKTYTVGGIMGGMASMEEDVLIKLGDAIVEALNDQSKIES